MKKLSYLFVTTLLSTACNSGIKNSNAEVQVEAGTEVVDTNSKLENQQLLETEKSNDILGFWVGYFQEDTKDNDDENGFWVDDGFYWNGQNKINISIDKINDTIVIGHSVVAGNNRPFIGTVKDGKFTVKEPGNNKYDGEFNFQIIDNKLVGKWSAYKEIRIKNRKYTLEKKEYTYNPDIMLKRVQEYINWNKSIKKKEKVEVEENEFEEWINKEFSSATELIYSINASNKLLTKSDVENLKKGDIVIIRNTIYARHGYSFKNQPLRVFFDAQDWYIPVHTDVKSELTDLEKDNIKLLLRYERNAKEYYDYFGRG